jgi:branched-chain amino acid transport system ATP-binding protein
VLVSHDLTSVYTLSDHIVVMNEGQILCEGDADMIRTNPAVIEAYLGAD